MQMLLFCSNFFCISNEAAFLLRRIFLHAILPKEW